jgi:D-arabinose 1-dehydrogenase-like Zn-dependent alcohol dehydrogenase
VANLISKDGEEFLALALEILIKTEMNLYPPIYANQALDDLRNDRFQAAVVITIYLLFRPGTSSCILIMMKYSFTSIG